MLGLLPVIAKGFKVINDSLGHMAGDQLLIEVSERLLTCLRGEDTVARLGGDEFTVLLEEVTRTEEAIACVRKIQAALSEPMLIDGKTTVKRSLQRPVLASLWRPRGIRRAMICSAMLTSPCTGPSRRVSRVTRYLTRVCTTR